MIGQRDLLSKIDRQLDNGKFPRFSILVGEVGSGRRTVARHIADRLDGTVCEVTTKIDDIRQVIETAYKVDSLCVVYVIANADGLSQAAANALLKVTEEPPNNAYFILTCEVSDRLLPTIKSRGVTYVLEPYGYNEKFDYLDTIELSDSDSEFLADMCSNIGEIKEMLTTDISAFRDFVNLVIDNIAEVSVSNALKISEKIAFKDEPDKYNLRLFWKAFNVICMDKILDKDVDNQLRFTRAVAITGDYLQELSLRGINKQMLFDNWVLDVRSEWS